jgi:hypothetical protein
MNTGTLSPNPSSSASASPNPVQRMELAWTSDASGDVDQKTPTINGTILSWEFQPGSGGSQPSDLYDLTISDTVGIDLLVGLGADLSHTTANRIIPIDSSSGLPFVVAEPLRVQISNAGDVKSGLIVLYWRP